MPSECFRALRTNIQFTSVERQQKVIGFTSAIADEGKSTTLVNVAITLAQSNNKVLLIEADLRKPGIAKIFGIDQKPGLTDILLGSYEWRDIVGGITDLMLGEMDIDDVVMTPGLDNLQIIPCGTLHANPSEILSSEELDRFIADVQSEYDIVLIDLPPLLAAADASIVSSKIDTVIMIYLAGKTARGALKRAIDQLNTARVEVLGIIINGLKAEMSLDYTDLHYNRYFAGDEGQSPGEVDAVRKIWGGQKGLSIDKNSQSAQPAPEGKRVWWKIAVVFLAVTLLGVGVFWQA
jgi:capsular exopolysaccharide synthesis family protein